MKTTKGLHLDSRPEDQPEGTYPYGKNGLQHDLIGSVSNEPGFRRVVTGAVKYQYQLNGILSTDTNEVILFMTNNTNSCIRLVDMIQEIVIYDFDDATKPYKLNFSVDNYITGQVQRNHLGELICAFTDKVEFPKMVNFSKPHPTNLKEWNLFPECNYPTITKVLEPGGFCEVGSYYFTGRYYKLDGTRTAVGPVGSGIAVTSLTNQSVADKAIRVTLSNLDPAYDFFELIVITRINGVTASKIVRLLPIVPGLNTTVFTNDGYFEDVPLDEVLAPPVSYDKVHSIGQLNDALYVGRLEKNKFITDMQQYANMIQLFWTSELIDVENCPEEHKSGEKKSLKHGEAYAVYIRYHLSNGEVTPAFTCPGPAATAGDLVVSSVGATGGLNTLKYKVEDCISTFSTSTKTGLPGPYLNDTELYPNTTDFDSTPLGGEDLRNTQVRHHRMPSLKWCKENLYSTVPEYGITKMDLLGLQTFNIIIPPKYANLIVGYEILYAKRTIQNMTQYGQSLLIYNAEKNGTPGTKYSLGQNWQVLQPAATAIYNPDTSSMRLHPFDILYNRPGVIPAYISAQYKLEGAVDVKYTPLFYPAGSPPTESQANSVVLVDMMKSGTTCSVSPANHIQGLDTPQYLLNNTITGSYINQYIESAYVAKLTGPAFPFTVQTVDNVAGLVMGSYVGGTVPPRVQNYLVDLCDVKVNLYENFYTQELVSMGNQRALTDNTPFWGGDIFLSRYTFHTYGIMDSNWENSFSSPPYYAEASMRGRRVVNRVITETVANLYTRSELAGNKYSKYFPQTALLGLTGNWKQVYPSDYDGTVDPNQFQISKGGEAINDFVSDDIFNPFKTYQTKFPYRIHRGGKMSRQNTRSWKTFLPLDFYEVQRNMGFIENLEGMDDRLLIHLTNSLFITQDKSKLEAGMLSVTLGSGDIFQFEPQEVQSSKLGYGGTQTDLACLRTPIGYVYPDTKQGEFYVYKNKELKQMTVGMYRFLREYLKILGNNPFTGNGVTIGWDQKYKRILATIKNIRPAGSPKVTPLVPEDITSIGTLLGGGMTFTDDCLFTTKGVVKPGDVIFMYNRYLVYKGINNITPGASSPYSCPPPDLLCEPPYDLVINQPSLDPPQAHITWAGAAGTFFWNLYKITASGLVPLASGTTTFQFQDFDDSILDPDVAYFFEVRRVCGAEYSTPVADSFSYPLPAIITPPPDPTSTTRFFRFIGMRGYPKHTCGVISNGVNDVFQAQLTVNGVVLGTYPLQAAPCWLSPPFGGFPNTWTHGSQIGPYFGATVTGSLTSATIEVVNLDISGNPANGAFSPDSMVSSSLTAVPGVLSGVNNHICTWTGVDLTLNSYQDITV